MCIPRTAQEATECLLSPASDPAQSIFHTETISYRDWQKPGLSAKTRQNPNLSRLRACGLKTCITNVQPYTKCHTGHVALWTVRTLSPNACWGDYAGVYCSYPPTVWGRGSEGAKAWSVRCRPLLVLAFPAGRSRCGWAGPVGDTVLILNGRAVAAAGRVDISGRGSDWRAG